MRSAAVLAGGQAAEGLGAQVYDGRLVQLGRGRDRAGVGSGIPADADSMAACARATHSNTHALAARHACKA